VEPLYAWTLDRFGKKVSLSTQRTHNFLPGLGKPPPGVEKPAPASAQKHETYRAILFRFMTDSASDTRNRKINLSATQGFQNHIL